MSYQHNMAVCCQIEKKNQMIIDRIAKVWPKLFSEQMSNILILMRLNSLGILSFDVQIVTLLLRFGANPHIRNDMQQTAADVAATDVINRFITHHHYDASVNNVNCEGDYEASIAKFSPIKSHHRMPKPFDSEKWQNCGDKSYVLSGHATSTRREEGSGDCATFPLMPGSTVTCQLDIREYHCCKRIKHA